MNRRFDQFTEHSVPYDEHASIVFVNTVAVPAVVHAVVTGCVQHIL